MGLHITELSHRIGQKHLLKDINAGIYEPMLIGIIGPNGAGKSTLMNCLTGLLPTQGAIELNGRCLETYGEAELASIRAVLAQDNHLNFPFLAGDIVGMSFAFSALSNTRQQQLIDQCLEVVSANGLAKRHFLSLSGGEKQRIHIARVLAQLLQHEPGNHLRYLFLDEPTAPLDLKHQLQLFNHLQDLKEHNICIITVIHDINLAAASCDQLWVMHEGRLVRQGTPDQVISKTLMNEVFEVDVGISCSGSKPVIHTSLFQ
jgi:iron complex transport system ATP-binding protein